MSTSAAPRPFAPLSRLLHWAMVAMVLSMLGVGAAMVASLGSYHALISVHRPLGLAVLALVVVRFVNRQLSPPPPLPLSLSRAERAAARASELTLYGLMFVLPLVGWGMMSAARYPVVLAGWVSLPDILPHDLALYAALRKAHTVLAYFLFLMVLAHAGAVLFHTLVVGDGLLWRMVPWKVLAPREPPTVAAPGRAGEGAPTGPRGPHEA